jgi:hypothetical protein
MAQRDYNVGCLLQWKRSYAHQFVGGRRGIEHASDKLLDHRGYPKTGQKLQYGSNT